MAEDVAALIEAGRGLDPDERAIVARELQQMDEPDQGEIDAAWRAEIGRRVDDIVDGRVDLVDHEETMAQARALLARLHQ
jgi:putative addiction module component (TIGR02574 family)